VTEIIDLTGERNKRAAPDPEFVCQDNYGRPMYLFLLAYEMGEKAYGAEVWAYDEADAEARVAAMKASLKVDGQLFEQVFV